MFLDETLVSEGEWGVADFAKVLLGKDGVVEVLP